MQSSVMSLTQIEGCTEAAPVHNLRLRNLESAAWSAVGADTPGGAWQAYPV